MEVEEVWDGLLLSNDGWFLAPMCGQSDCGEGEATLTLGKENLWCGFVVVVFSF